MKKILPVALSALVISLVACGPARQTVAKKTSSGAIVSGAGLTIGKCTAMSQGGAQGNFDAQMDFQALSGFYVCTTNDPHTVALQYSTWSYASSSGAESYTAITGSSYQQVNFTASTSQGQAFVKFDADFNSIYVIRQKDASSFGEYYTGAYDYASFR